MAATRLGDRLRDLPGPAADAWHGIRAAYDGWRPESRIYARALGLFAGAVLLADSSDPVVTGVVGPVILFLSLLLFGAGFLTWLFRTVSQWWKSAAGRSAIVLFNGAVLLLAVGPARTIVANALGLPPTDFDLTVGICVLLLYPMVALVILMMAMAGLSALLLLAAMVPDRTWDAVEWWTATTLRVVFAVREPPDLLEMIEERTSLAVIAHFFGCAIVAAAVGTIIAQAREPVIEPVVRNIAYLTEYHELSGYPGIDGTRPAKIHAGAMVSYARRVGTWDVEISEPCRLPDGCARSPGGSHGGDARE